MAPRSKTLQTIMYRIVSSLEHDALERLDTCTLSPVAFPAPNSYFCLSIPVHKTADWVSAQELRARNGGPATENGLTI